MINHYVLTSTIRSDAPGARSRMGAVRLGARIFGVRTAAGGRAP